MEENTEEEIVFFQVSDIKTRIISLAVAVYSFLGPIGVIAAIFDILPAYVYTYATHTDKSPCIKYNQNCFNNTLRSGIL